MPIFHDHDDEPAQASQTSQRPLERPWQRQHDDPAAAKASRPDVFASSFTTGRRLSRGELIERLKRKQSPPWQTQPKEKASKDAPSTPHSSSTESSPKLTVSQLLPAVELHERAESTLEPSESNQELGRDIERPKSALHRGDFRPPQQTPSADGQRQTPLATSSIAPWHHEFPHAAQKPFHRDATLAFGNAAVDVHRRPARARATSQSSLSNFVLMPPTSPLVHASTNPDLDFASRPASRRSQSPEKNTRRHTFSPQSFQYFGSSDLGQSVPSPSPNRNLPLVRREGTFPYQAHQPRRSLSNISNVYSKSPNFHSISTPQTPQLHPRRPSISSESPLQHAPMVGSYEESILRGRMSTTPSRPLNFVADIGVLGKGRCKPSLKCPPHVTVPFPAVFYSYNSGAERLSNDSPSPYVGLIDLENSLPPAADAEKTRRRHRHHNAASDNDQSDRPMESSEKLIKEMRIKEKMKRRSTSPKSPPGGSYRIPQQGQLQIIIKNPNKTAVKLFLVPYDLSDMEPGQKTFIRQRSYSAGPIIDMPMAYRKNLGSDRPEASLSTSDDPNDRPVLRYLIHLHMCCPSKGRYFLYKSIRVVFANRVPDDKEKLRNEIQLPEPRYSAYKPMRDSAANAHGTSSAGAALASEQAMRRRSIGISLSRSIYDGIDGIGGTPPGASFQPLSTSSSGYGSPIIRPIPFSFPRLDTVESRPVSRDQMDVDASPASSQPFSFLPLTSPMNTAANPPGLDISNSEQTYEKWTRGANGYSSGSSYGSIAAPPAIGEGLLARRLRGLDVHHSTLEPEHNGSPKS